eukprot:1442087-Rhodomonas_salina.2
MIGYMQGVINRSAVIVLRDAFMHSLRTNSHQCSAASELSDLHGESTGACIARDDNCDLPTLD